MHKYTVHAMWDTVAIGHIADLNRASCNLPAESTGGEMMID